MMLWLIRNVFNFEMMRTKYVLKSYIVYSSHKRLTNSYLVCENDDSLSRYHISVPIQPFQNISFSFIVNLKVKYVCCFGSAHISFKPSINHFNQVVVMCCLLFKFTFLTRAL